MSGPEPGTEAARVLNEIDRRSGPVPAVMEFRGIVIIAIDRYLNFEITMEWLEANIPGDAGQQIKEAAVVLVTHRSAVMASVIKCEPDAIGEHLMVHQASIG